MFTEAVTQAKRSRLLFVGIGTGRPHPTRPAQSFVRLAETATGGRYQSLADKYKVVGEINNQPFGPSGENVFAQIPALADHFINLVTLEDLRELAADHNAHRLVGVAGGSLKAEAIRVALQSGLVNVIITNRNVAKTLVRHRRARER